MKTEKFQLRMRTKEHFEYLRNATKKEQLAFFGFKDEKNLLAEIRRFEDRLSWIQTKYFLWDIIEKTSKHVVGSCGFHSCFPEHQRAEVGYFIHEAYRGQGYMTEVLRAVIAYGFNTLKLNRIEALLDPENIPSRRLTERFGFVKEGILKEHYAVNGVLTDSLICGLLKSNYNETL